jgi:SAM-dependent methyltransferase
MGAAGELVRAVDLRLQMVRHRGRNVFCPLCGHQFASFKDERGRRDALCWRCGSHERHRAQWLLFERRPELLGQARALLHFAPEWALRRRLEALDHLRYVTADLAQPGVDLHLDLTALDLPDASFDAVICSHVLEHVENDLAAMRELRRITTEDGWCLVMVPLDLARDRTYEDPSITGGSDREHAFGQHDHVRLYAADVGERLTDAGFDVEVIRPRDEFGAAVVARCRLLEVDQIYLCRPQRS